VQDGADLPRPEEGKHGIGPERLLKVVSLVAPKGQVRQRQNGPCCLLAATPYEFPAHGQQPRAGAS
jgi:hypothetical protein